MLSLSGRDADDSSVQPLTGTCNTTHTTRFLETGTAPLEQPLRSIPHSGRRPRRRRGFGGSQARIKAAGQRSGWLARDNKPPITAFTAPATPELCQIGRFTSSSCPWPPLLRLPSCFPERSVAQHLKSLTTLVKRDWSPGIVSPTLHRDNLPPTADADRLGTSVPGPERVWTRPFSLSCSMSSDPCPTGCPSNRRDIGVEDRVRD